MGLGCSPVPEVIAAWKLEDRGRRADAHDDRRPAVHSASRVAEVLGARAGARGSNPTVRKEDAMAPHTPPANTGLSARGRTPGALPMTAAGLTALEAELAALEGEGRREIAQRIKTAREWGDLKENSEYHDAKNDQAHLETKIARLRERLLGAEVRDPHTGSEAAGFGSRVTIRDELAGREHTYTLVSAPESKPAEGLIASDSPVGRALTGARAGDTVTVAAPRGPRTLAVLAVV
jgi:transcription elongation factor GreA